MFVAASAAFALLHAAPGDPYSDLDRYQFMSADVREAQRARRGLDLPLRQQYARWIGSLVRGDLGWSTLEQRAVRDVIRDALPRTVGLMTLALIGSLVIGIAIGAWQGTRTGSVGDRMLSLLAMLLYSIPEFALAATLMLLLTPWLLPVGGIMTEGFEQLAWPARAWNVAQHLVLPWLSLSLIGAAVVARYQRSATRDVFRQPFIQTARAKGLGVGAVRWHAMRASLLPVIALTGMLFPSLLTGAVFVEQIFNWPGMGLQLLRGLDQHDYDLVTSLVLGIAALTILGSLIADLLRDLADPRVRSAVRAD